MIERIAEHSTTSQYQSPSETFAVRTGQRLSNTERQLRVLFASGGKKTQNAERVLQEIGSSLGLSKSETESLTVEGGIQVLQMRHDAAKRAYVMLSELMKSTHEMLMAVIRNIGR